MSSPKPFYSVMRTRNQGSRKPHARSYSQKDNSEGNQIDLTLKMSLEGKLQDQGPHNEFMISDESNKRQSEGSKILQKSFTDFMINHEINDEENYDSEQDQSQKQTKKHVIKADSINQDKTIENTSNKLENMLENIQISYKNIQNYEQEQQARRQAAYFVYRIKQKKQQMYGKYHSIRTKQTQRKRQQEIQQKNEERMKKNEERIKKIMTRQQKIQQIRERITQREQQIRRRRPRESHHNKMLKSSVQKIQKIRIRSEMSLPKPEVKKSTQLGNEYLRSCNKQKKRSYSQAEAYRLLNENQRKQIQAITRKIQLIKSLQRK